MRLCGLGGLALAGYYLLDSLLASAFHYSVEVGSRYFGITSDVVSPRRDALESRAS